MIGACSIFNLLLSANQKCSVIYSLYTNSAQQFNAYTLLPFSHKNCIQNDIQSKNRIVLVDFLLSLFHNFPQHFTHQYHQSYSNAFKYKKEKKIAILSHFQP